MQQTVTVHGHFKTIDGKVIWVPEHQRHVEVALDDDFQALVQEHGVKPIQKPAPKPQAEVPFASLKAGQIIEKPSTGGKWLIVSHDGVGMMLHPLHEENLDGKKPSDFAVTASEWSWHMGVNAQVSDPKPKAPEPKAPTTLDEDFAAFVQEHGVKPVKAAPQPQGSPAKPMPAPVKPATWTADQGKVHGYWIGHNTEPGHNKVYKVGLLESPNGDWFVVGQYGKTGGALKQIVYPYPHEHAALQAFYKLKKAKIEKGYNGANSDVWAQVESTPWDPIPAGGTGVPSTNARSGPKTQAPEPTSTPAPVQPAAPAAPPAITQKTMAYEVTSYTDQKGGTWGVHWMMSGVKPELRISIPGGDISKLDQDQLEALAKVGATWMPKGHKFTISLNGKPWASGKGQAQAVHDMLLGFGAKPSKQTAPQAAPKAQGITSDKLASVALLKLSGNETHKFENGVEIGIGKVGSGKSLRVFSDSITYAQHTALIKMGMNNGSQQGKSYLWIKAKPSKNDDWWAKIATVLNDKAPGQGEKPLEEGAIKFENGKMYKLNANHRWEAMEKEPPAPIFTAPVEFPFKQVGPQAGSNPGGLYEDAAGKKWYIKFPATEDHAKNELLAAKLYHALGLNVPQVKLVKKDGKVGIASRIIEGLKADPDGLAKAPGATEGFGADAWLGNRDVVGLGFDNMLIGPDGKAYRIDPGGALIYRAMGALKDDFGNEVTEASSLINPAKNANTAKVFSGMTQTQKDHSVALVLEMPDEVITQAVMAYGPGTEDEKKALAAKLIARKKDLAEKFPGAFAIANPPTLDPTKLPVDKHTFPGIPNFLDWEGTGKGLSGNAQINQENQESAKKIYEAATAGNLVALKAMTITPVGGKPTHISNHPSTHINKMYAQCVATLEAIADPNTKKAKSWSFDDDYSAVEDLGAAFPAYFYGVTKTNIDQKKRIGYWLHIGKAAPSYGVIPNKTHFITDEESAAASKANKTMPQIVRKFMKDVKASGHANEPYRNGAELDHSGNKCRDVIALAYAHAVPFEEGAIILRQQSETPEDKGMIQKLLALKPGDMLQNPGSMCCSKLPEWNWGGQMDLEIVMAKGAKALYNIGVGGHNSEQEITTLPGQRFMLLEHKEKGPKGTPWFRLLALPPDPTYIENLSAPKKGNAA